MYFESRIYKTRQCPTISAIADIIKGKTEEPRYTFDAFTVDLGKGKQLIVVDDSHCDNSFLEVAVLLKEGDKINQIESITAGWIKTAEKLALYFKDAVQGAPAINRPVTLNLGQASNEATANFTCGCCANRFKGNVNYQLKFDQDNGYGICKDCEKYYL